MLQKLLNKLRGRIVIHDVIGDKFILQHDICHDGIYYAERLAVRVALATNGRLTLYRVDPNDWDHLDPCWVTNNYLNEGTVRLGCHRFGNAESDVIRRWAVSQDDGHHTNYHTSSKILGATV